MALCAAIAGSAPALGQANQVGGTVTDQFARPELPTSQPIAPYRIERPGQNAVPDTVRFAVRRIVVDGAQSLEPPELAVLTAPLEGRTLSFGDLTALADRITALYAKKGYALSFALVPEQAVEGGVVRVRVVEGAIDAVRVEFRNAPPLVGRKRIEDAIRRRLGTLIAVGPVRSKELERAVLGIDDLAGLDVTLVIGPSATTEGAASLTVLVTSNPITASLGTDNRLRAAFGREEGYATLAFSSVGLVGDRIELSGRSALNGDSFGYFSARYEAPLGHGLTRGHGRYARARIKATDGTLGALEYVGIEESFALGLRHALLRSRAQSLYASVELAGIDSNSALLGQTLVRERLRTVSANLTYDWADGGSRSLASLGFTQGLEALGATDRNNPLRSRSQGRPDANFISARLYRDQALPAQFRLRLDVDAQVLTSSRALLAASECTFGGPALGRAFDAGTLSGDECLRFGAELARPITIAGAAVEPYVFADYGIARQQGALEAGEARRREAGSYGVGLRLFTKLGLTADFSVAKPGLEMFPGDNRNLRFFFQISFQR